VRSIAPAVDTKTHAASISIEPSDPDHQLKPGMQAMVTIVSVKPDALVVPRGAVLGSPIPGAEATIITVNDNRAERKSVRLGQVTTQVAEVASGLAEGDMVAIANAGSLNTGDLVTAVPQTTGRSSAAAGL